MQIGQLARRAGVPIDTVRYYERDGVLPVPARHASGVAACPGHGVLERCPILNALAEDDA